MLFDLVAEDSVPPAVDGHGTAGETEEVDQATELDAPAAFAVEDEIPA